MSRNQQLFSGMSKNLDGQQQELNHDTRVTYRVIFQGKQKKKSSLWGLLSKEDLYGKVSIGSKKHTTRPLTPAMPTNILSMEARKVMRSESDDRRKVGGIVA